MPALAERYQGTNAKPREIVGSAAFNLEYRDQARSRSSIRDDIVSYLGEYRFEIPRYEYSLFYVRDHTGETSIFAQDQEPLIAKSRRAIKERKLRGSPTHREESETLGLANLASQLKTAKTGDTIFWASPPGPKEEGYGDYGFIYKGKIQEGTIRMAALRVESPTVEQYNRAMSALTGAQFEFSRADEFLSSPHVVSEEIPDFYVDHILKQAFSYSPNSERQQEFDSVIRILDPLIDRAIYAIKNGSKDEKLATFYALENYAIELGKHNKVSRDEQKRFLDGSSLDSIISQLSYEPPVARGSCGSSSSSNSLFSGDSIVSGMLSQDKYGDREFKCPKCNMVNVRPMDELLERCQHCGTDAVSCEE